MRPRDTSQAGAWVLALTLTLTLMAGATRATAPRGVSQATHVWTMIVPPSSTQTLPFMTAQYRYGGTVGFLGRLDSSTVANFAANGSSPTPTSTLTTPDPFPSVLAGGDNDVGYVFVNSSSSRASGGCVLDALLLPGPPGSSVLRPTWSYDCPAGAQGFAVSSGNGELLVLGTVLDSAVDLAFFTPSSSSPFLSVPLSKHAPELDEPLPALVSFASGGPGVFVSDGHIFAVVSSFTGKITRRGKPGSATGPITGVCGGGDAVVVSGPGFPDPPTVLAWSGSKLSPVYSAANASVLAVLSQDCASLAVMAVPSRVVQLYALANGAATLKDSFSLPFPATNLSLSPSAAVLIASSPDVDTHVAAIVPSTRDVLSLPAANVDPHKIAAFEPPAPNGILAYVFLPGYDYSSSRYQLSYYTIA